MPYKIQKQPSGKFSVINSQTGENKGESASKAMATAHMQALYANENKIINR